MGFMDLVNPASSIAQSYQQKKSAKQALRTQQAAADREYGLISENKEMMRPFYDLGLPAFKSYASAVSGGIDPNTGKAWTPTVSPAYKWQQEQANKATSRSLRALGRQNSTFGMNTIANSNRNLAADEYDRQIGRLADMTNIARGGASQLAGQNQNLGSSLVRMGDNKANYQLAMGQLKSEGIGKQNEAAGDAIKTYLSMYGGGMFKGGR